MATTTQTVYSGYAATVLGSSTFNRPGYELTAWGTTSTGGQLYTPGSQYTFNAPASLYAQWDYKPITLTYGSTINPSVYKFNSRTELAYVNSAGTVLSPYSDVYLTVPTYLSKCEDLGPGCITTIASYGFYSVCWHLNTCTAPKCETIGNYAFAGCWNLVNISFPACTTIGSFAFSGCDSIATASFPACTTIGSKAFYGCEGLVTASFPACTKMGNDAFDNCPKLQNLYFPNLSNADAADFTNCSWIDTVTLGTTGTLGNIFPSAKDSVRYMTLPSCTVIGVAFSGYTNLISISAPVCTKVNGLQGCDSLKIASFPECTETNENALESCFLLQKLYMPKCTTVSGTIAANCSNLTHVTLGTATVKQFSSAKDSLRYISFSNATTLASYSGYTELETAILPACSEITGVGFYNCTALKSVYMPACTKIYNTTSSAYKCAFVNCTDFSITLGLTSLRSETFSQAKLRSIYLPNCTALSDCALINQSTLRWIDASNVTSIYQSACKGCTDIAELEFPLCSKVEPYAFAGCTGLVASEAVNLATCGTLGSHAFEGCTALTYISLPAMTSLGQQCFNGCIELATVSMPTVTTLGSSAFSGCTKLRSIYIGPSTKSSNISTVFNGLADGYTIYIPSAKLATYKTSAGWSAYSGSMAGY